MGDEMNFTIKMWKSIIKHRIELIEKNEEDDTMYGIFYVNNKPATQL